MAEAAPSFLARNEFIIRRLHSLSGLIPVGAYMVVHLATNASVLNSPGTFQRSVYTIHSLGALLPWVEWIFIFIPIIFHAVVGVVIVAEGLPNTGSYPYGSNVRYTLQRATGMIAFVFIGWHVFHMHGWFHNEWWTTNVTGRFYGAQFRPYSAGSTAGLALQNMAVVALYAIGVLASVFHLANGIWSMGITWGVWTSVRAQRRALAACTVFGIALAAVGIGAIYGLRNLGTGANLQETRELEERMYQWRIEAGELLPDPHKLAEPLTEE